MQEQERLAAVNSLDTCDGTTAEFDVPLQLASKMFLAPMAAVSFIDEGSTWHKACLGLNLGQVPRDGRLFTETVKYPDQVLYVSDAAEDPRFTNDPLVAGEFGLRFFAGAAVMGPAGQPLGAICVMDRQPRHIQAETISHLKLLAASVNQTIRLHDALRLAHRLAGAGSTADDATRAGRTGSGQVAAVEAAAGAVPASVAASPAMSPGESSIEDLLRHALVPPGREPFTLAIQPIFELETGDLAGFEAFVRWPDPVSGLTRPLNRFLPVAEATGLIVPLDRWVCDQACRVAAAWPARLGISANVSAANFLDAGFVETVSSALERHALSPGRLKLEVTELAFVREPSRVRQVIAELQALGVKVMVDNFGSGHSAMAYLHDYTFDGLKIDRSFTAEIETDTRKLAVVQMIVGVARSNGISVTVEGVETTSQLNLLRVTGVDCVQGYLLGRPAAPAEFARLIALSSDAA